MFLKHKFISHNRSTDCAREVCVEQEICFMHHFTFLDFDYFWNQ